MGVLGLSHATRQQLEKILAHPDNPRQLKRAQALLWVDEGDSVTAVAQRLRVSRQSIYNWIVWIRQRGGQPVAKRLCDADRSGRPPEKARVVDEVIANLIGTDPRQKGYRATVWTNPLFREYLRAEYGLEVSHQTVRESIHRAGYRWKRPRYVLSRRSKYWRQAKGGSNEGSKGVSARSF